MILTEKTQHQCEHKIAYTKVKLDVIYEENRNFIEKSEFKFLIPTLVVSTSNLFRAPLQRKQEKPLSISLLAHSDSPDTFKIRH